MASRAAEPAEVLTKLAPSPLTDVLSNAARSKGIAIDRIDPPIDVSRISPGDSVSALVTLFRKDKPQTQWLIDLKAVAPTPKEQSAKPPSPTVLYSTMGNRFEFATTPAYASVTTLGPFVFSKDAQKEPAPSEEVSRVRLAKDFLGLGLDRSSAAAYRMKRVKTKDLISFKSSPYDVAEVARGRALLPEIQLSPDEERSICGSAPSLVSYFDIVQQTRGLNRILLKLVEMPSIWSIVKHGGVGDISLRFDRSNIAPVDLAPWGVSSAEKGYQMPLMLLLDGQPALRLTFLVTAPRPPLLMCAGVVALLAEKPDDKNIYLTLRVLSARRSAEN